MTNCLYWAVANLPVICLYIPDSYILVIEGYRYEEGLKVKCLIHAAIRFKTSYLQYSYIDFNGMHKYHPLDSWARDWTKERQQENCKHWDYSYQVYLLKDIKTKKFWKRMEYLGSPYDKNILEQEGLKIFNMCYGDL